MLKTIQKKPPFGSSSLLRSIFQACRWSWKPPNLPFVMPSHWLCGIYNLEEKKCFHCDGFTMIPSAAKTNSVCSCVSSSDGAMLQANGTHKNQMGQAEGMYAHTNTHSSWLFFCAFTLFSLWTSLTVNSPCQGSPLLSMVTIQYAPVAPPAKHVILCHNVCCGDQSSI